MRTRLCGPPHRGGMPHATDTCCADTSVGRSTVEACANARLHLIPQPVRMGT
jgi:hypothetical protein